MAATNRADILDPALLRPGRFDRQVKVGYPDIKGREAILKVHARSKPMESTVDFRKIAQSTIGFTGADLANLLNEAALHAAKNNKSLIGMEDIEKSYMKILLGPQKKTRVRTEADNKLTAYHEAGHAVASYYCEHTDPVKFISTVPAGNAGGVTVSIPEEDVSYSTKKQMFDSIVLALGGRVAEQIVLDDISTGASGDIQQATKVARNMVTRYGMSDKLGTVLYGSDHSDTEVFLGRDFNNTKNFSEKIAAEIDDEVRAIIESAYAECTKILTEHIDKLHFIAGYLLKAEFMDGDQFKAAMENDLTFEDIDEIAKEKERKSREENEAKLLAEQEEQRKVEEELRREKEERERMMNAPAGQTFYDTDDNNSESVDKE
jgi:cell division protease FtsH